MHLVFVSGQIPLAHCAAEGVGALIESILFRRCPLEPVAYLAEPAWLEDSSAKWCSISLMWVSFFQRIRLPQIYLGWSPQGSSVG